MSNSPQLGRRPWQRAPMEAVGSSPEDKFGQGDVTNKNEETGEIVTKRKKI